jgi:membrane protein YdbS with pleckstrin-like domain
MAIMGIYRCSECSFERTTSEDTIGKQAKCPACGTMNTIVDFDVSQRTPVSSYVPPEGKVSRVKDLLHPGEQVLYDRKPSAISMLLTMVFPGIVAIGSFFTLMAGEGVIAIPILLVATIVIICIYYSWKCTEYVVTEKRSFLKKGVFNHRIIILMNRNIQTISINTGIVDRLLGLNTITVTSAASGVPFFGMNSGGIAYRHIDSVRDFMRAYGQ